MGDQEIGWVMDRISLINNTDSQRTVGKAGINLRVA